MLASKSRGYQAKGTVIVRPSTRSTASVVWVTCTSRTRSPGLGWEVFIPPSEPSDGNDHGFATRGANQPLYVIRVTRQNHRLVVQSDGYHNGVNHIGSSRFS